MRWKIFIVSCYLVLSGSILFLIRLLQVFTAKPGPENYPGHFEFALTLSLVLIANAAFEAVFYHRFFPDRDVPRGYRRWHWFFTVLYTCCLLVLLLLTITGTNEEIVKGQYSRSGMRILAFLYFLLVILIFNYTCQLSIVRYIRKKFERKIAGIVNSIGSD